LARGYRLSILEAPPKASETKLKFMPDIRASFGGSRFILSLKCGHSIFSLRFPFRFLLNGNYRWSTGAREARVFFSRKANTLERGPLRQVPIFIPALSIHVNKAKSWCGNIEKVYRRQKKRNKWQKKPPWGPPFVGFCQAKNR
jgi:hypothetical protein